KRNVSAKTFFPVLMQKALERNSHSHSGMRADGSSGQVDLSIVRLDNNRDHLPDWQRRKRIHVASASGNVRQSSPIPGVSFFGMNADTSITGIPRIPSALLVFSGHVVLLPT